MTSVFVAVTLSRALNYINYTHPEAVFHR